MNTDRSIRTTLWISVAVNVVGFAVFANAAVGRGPGLLPVPIAPFYAAELALVIGLFAGVYAWLALQREVDQPLLLAGALGKLGFFMLFVAYWAAGDLTWFDVTQALPDLVLGIVFLRWLRNTSRVG